MIASTALALAMIAAFALIGGGLHLLIRRKECGKGLLMLTAAAVLIANVAIVTV